ncbi:MAG: hypothetical protein RLZZ301_722 [Bacteroidota bacterium]|jgi:exopolyphosphatase/guanosine-5'-triphosphate,3'-diphosphate pyrophosphatase
MRRALIDLGTNTFNLLIADVAAHYQIVHQEKNGVALGMGGINQQRIAPDAMERALQALHQFKQRCDALHVESIRAIGTSALRDARNRDAFCALALQQTGIEIEVISGDQEAQLIYEGVRHTHSFERASLIMDIGGGSTELIAVEDGQPLHWKSFDIGVSRMAQSFQVSDPLSATDITQLENYLEMHCLNFLQSVSCSDFIGASGSFETFFELVHEQVYVANGQAQEVSTSHFLEMLEYIIRSTQAERDANDWIIPIRKRMAPFAAVKTRWMIRQLKPQRIFVSPYSLKEGALLSTNSL